MADLTLRDVKKSYGNLHILHGIDLDIKSGEFIVFVGPSGCGKSTLLRSIAGLEEITGGTLEIAGEKVNDIPPSKRGIAMVFQSYALYPHMTVYDNMAFGMKIAKESKAEIDKRVRAAAEILQLTKYLDRLPKAMSGGQRQRVAMGRAIVRSPKVFLFDEPLSNLDAKLRGQMRVEIKSLQRKLGVTSVYVTHDQLEAMTLADVLVVMNAGLVEQLGAPLDIYEKPASTFVASFIGAPPMNLLPLRSGQLEGAVSLPAIPANAATIGFRPEDCEVGADGAASEGGLRLMARVLGVEPVGAESFLYCEAAGGRIVVRVPGRTAVAVGDQLPILARREKVHFFGSDGKRV